MRSLRSELCDVQNCANKIKYGIRGNIPPLIKVPSLNSGIFLRERVKIIPPKNRVSPNAKQAAKNNFHYYMDWFQ